MLPLKSEKSLFPTRSNSFQKPVNASFRCLSHTVRMEVFFTNEKHDTETLTEAPTRRDEVGSLEGCLHTKAGNVTSSKAARPWIQMTVLHSLNCTLMLSWYIPEPFCLSEVPFPSTFSNFGQLPYISLLNLISHLSHRVGKMWQALIKGERFFLPHCDRRCKQYGARRNNLYASSFSARLQS